ncbi:MAG: DUF2304 domain-containing protein [bacterium]|nr:DUF2304 domain-containing protein [bacterium]
MTLFQIIASLFALWMMYEVHIYRKKNVLSKFEFLGWISVWLTFIIITIFPDLLLGIAQQLRFARVFDLLTVLAFIILTVLIFLSYFAQKESQLQIKKLVRTLAIKDAIDTTRQPKKLK